MTPWQAQWMAHPHHHLPSHHSDLCMGGTHFSFYPICGHQTTWSPGPHYAPRFDHCHCLQTQYVWVSLSSLSTVHDSIYLNTYLYSSPCYSPSLGHMSLHLPHFFNLFNPARTFWTYPFEHLIGHIQQLISNHQLGKVYVFECVEWCLMNT